MAIPANLSIKRFAGEPNQVEFEILGGYDKIRTAGRDTKLQTDLPDLQFALIKSENAKTPNDVGLYYSQDRYRCLLAPSSASVLTGTCRLLQGGQEL